MELQITFLCTRSCQPDLQSLLYQLQSTQAIHCSPIFRSPPLSLSFSPSLGIPSCSSKVPKLYAIYKYWISCNSRKHQIFQIRCYDFLYVRILSFKHEKDIGCTNFHNLLMLTIEPQHLLIILFCCLVAWQQSWGIITKFNIKITLPLWKIQCHHGKTWLPLKSMTTRWAWNLWHNMDPLEKPTPKVGIFEAIWRPMSPTWKCEEVSDRDWTPWLEESSESIFLLTLKCILEAILRRSLEGLLVWMMLWDASYYIQA